MYRLLLLIENSDLGGILQAAFSEYASEVVTQADRAHDAFCRGAFDLAIIDLPHASRSQNLDLIRKWRAAGGTLPVIAISSIPQASLAVETLDAGADDFLRKPFHCEELRVRMQKLLHRRAPTDLRKAGGVILSPATFFFAGVQVTPDLTLKFPNGVEEPIRAKQFGILREFAEQAGGLVLKEKLIKAVWGSDAHGYGNSVNEYISILRRLFWRQGVDFNRWVISEPKAGWRIAAAAAQASAAVP